MLHQMEVRIVLFDPSPGFFAADVYINGNRVFTGPGKRTEQAAIKSACDWMEQENYTWRSRLRMHETAA